MADWIDHERGRMLEEADAKEDGTMLTHEEPDDFWPDEGNDDDQMPAGWWIVLVTIISLLVWWFFGRWLLK